MGQATLARKGSPPETEARRSRFRVEGEHVVKSRRVIFVTASIAMAFASLVTSQPRTAAAAARPNVVIIMTDDQRWDTVTSRYMPRLARILSKHTSVTYTNSFVPNSLCCPSRTSALTGDYSHTTGVYGNGGQWGGFHSFTPAPEGHSTSSINDTTTIAVDMQEAGYQTALIGKYLNGYSSRFSNYTPPGWDRWFAVPTGAYYGYWAATKGARSVVVRNRHFGTTSDDYITRVLTNRAIRFIQNSDAEPFFLYYATTAPHTPAMPDPRDVGRFGLRGYVQSPSFGRVEAGAPKYIKSRPWDSSTAREVNSFHKLQLDSIYGVDRSIGQIWRALPDDTIILFMSDNGYMWGEHRWQTKFVPYDSSLRIPITLFGKDLQTRFPTGSGPCPSMYAFAMSCDGRIVLNVDVAPTLEQVAGVASNHAFEGLDMLTSARKDFVIEHWYSRIYDAGREPPTYCGVRSAGWMYVRYKKFEEPIYEGLYNEKADTWEMNNLAVTDPEAPTVAGVLQTMRNRAATLCRVDGGIYPNDWPFQG